MIPLSPAVPKGERKLLGPYLDEQGNPQIQWGQWLKLERYHNKLLEQGVEPSQAYNETRAMESQLLKGKV